MRGPAIRGNREHGRCPIPIDVRRYSATLGKMTERDGVAGATKLDRLATKLGPQMKKRAAAERRKVGRTVGAARKLLREAGVFGVNEAQKYAREASEKLAKTMGKAEVLKAAEAAQVGSEASGSAGRKPSPYPPSSLLTTYILQVAYPGAKNPALDKDLARLVGVESSEDFEPYMFENRRWLVWSGLPEPMALRAMAVVKDARAGAKGKRGLAGRVSRIEVLSVASSGVVTTVACDAWEGPGARASGARA